MARYVPSSRRAWFAAIATAAVALELYLLFGARNVEPGGTLPHPVEEFASGSMVAQTFTAPYAGLESVTLFTEGGERSQAKIWMRLLVEDREGEALVASAIVGPDDDGKVRLYVPLQPGSRAQVYRVEARALERMAGVRLLAFSNGFVQPGTMSVGGVERWGDLRLRVSAASRYRSFVASAPRLRGRMSHPALHMLLLALGNWATLTFAYYMLASGTGSGFGARS